MKVKDLTVLVWEALRARVEEDRYGMLWELYCWDIEDTAGMDPIGYQGDMEIGEGIAKYWQRILSRIAEGWI